MNRLFLIAALILASGFSVAEFSCPDGTEAACIDAGDRICSSGTKCVDENTSCFDDFPCSAEEGFVCGSEYDSALNNHKRSTDQYDQLARENVDLRQERLDRKNCVLNATSLIEAQRCVR